MSLNHIRVWHEDDKGSFPAWVTCTRGGMGKFDGLSGLSRILYHGASELLDVSEFADFK